jgi:hypothetical protein
VCYTPPAHTGVRSIPDFLWSGVKLLVWLPGSLTPGPSFDHNLCCICPNDSCEAIFDIYTSRPFQQYKENLKARFFDPCNRALKFRESRRTPSSHFWECEFHPYTCLKVGLRHFSPNDITTQTNALWSVMNVVLEWSSRAIWIWWYLDKPSKKNTPCPKLHLWKLKGTSLFRGNFQFPKNNAYSQFTVIFQYYHN